MNAILNVNKTAAPKEEPVTASQLSLGETMEQKARALGAAKSELLGGTIGMIAKAKQEYEGGPFAVLFKLTANMTEEEADALPEPGQENGNNPAIYKVSVIGDKGKSRTATHNFYNIMSDNLACNVQKAERINQLQLSLGDPAKVNMANVPQDIKDMDLNYRHAEISRLQGELATSRAAINRAFELMFQIRAVNSLPGVTAFPIMAVGKDGKESTTEVENTRTPMVVMTTDDKRKMIDVARMSVTSFNKLKPNVAAENGGTYAALMKTVERGTKKADEPGGNKPDKIATLDKFHARVTDIHDYLDELHTERDKARYQELLKTIGPRGPAGSDDLALSLYEIYRMLGAFYRHDAIRTRAEKLKEATDTGENKATA